MYRTPSVNTLYPVESYTYTRTLASLDSNPVGGCTVEAGLVSLGIKNRRLAYAFVTHSSTGGEKGTTWPVVQLNRRPPSYPI